jgi:cell division protease FtsH
MVTSASISTGAGDDIRRATDLAHRAVAEYGMSTAVGPLSVSALAAGGEEYSLLMDGGGEVSKSVEKEVRSLCESALAAARDVIVLNKDLHARISGELEREERLDGAALREVLEKTQVPQSLRKFVLGVGK